MSDRSSASIQRDIENARAQMRETIDALERKFSPGELLDVVVDRFRGRSHAGRSAAGIGETIRDHPVPIALVGLGLGLLAIDRMTGGMGSREAHVRQRLRHEPVGEGTYARAEGRVGPYRGDEIIDPKYRYGSEEGIAGRARDRVAALGDEVRDRIANARDAARERMAEVRHRDDGFEDEAPPMRSGGATYHARGGLEERIRSMLEGNPLAMGALTFGLGLAAGASAPTSRSEERLMGGTADAFKEGFGEVAREKGRQVREVAHETLQAVRSEVDRRGLRDELEGMARGVLDTASDTARRSAAERGLTGDEMRERTREIGQRTISAARRVGSRLEPRESGEPLHPYRTGTPRIRPSREHPFDDDGSESDV